MFWRKRICPKCKTGKESYALDPKSVTCPNIGFYINGKCPFFVPIEKRK